MSRATRLWSTFTALAVAGIAAGAPAAHAEPKTRWVAVTDSAFTPPEVEGFVGDSIAFVLHQDAQLPHTVTSDTGLFDLNFDQRRFTGLTIDTPGRYPYHCKNHGAAGGTGMSGVIVIHETAATTTTTEPASTTTTIEPASTTTTTAAPEPTSTTATTAPPTSSTTAPPVATTTTRPPTTTTRPPTTTAPPSTSPPAVVSGASEPTTTTTAKKSATTTAKKSTTTQKAGTTTAPPAESPSTVPAMPSLAAATPPPSAPALPTAVGEGPHVTELDKEALGRLERQDDHRGGADSKRMVIGLGLLGVLLLGAGLWGWYHRSSRYLPA